MARMVHKQIYIQERQGQLLRRISKARGVSEAEVIRQAIEREAIGGGDWQVGAKLESAQKMYKGLNRRAYATQVWDWYAIPWRHKDGLIHLIWSPRDVMGSPTIHSYPVNDFLRGLSGKQEAIIKQLTQSSRRLVLWRNIGIAVLILLGILLFIFIYGMLAK